LGTENLTEVLEGSLGCTVHLGMTMEVF
jgi:hypothetical protein